MRQIRSFEDAQIAIRELFNYVDYLRTQNIDLNKRRIKNASPSVDLYDYVVRKELEDLRPTISTEVASTVAARSGYSVIFSSYFPFGGNPASPGYVIQRTSVLSKVTFIALSTNGSPSLRLNLLKNFTDDILTNDLIINPSYTEKTIITITDLAITSFAVNDVITVKASNASQIYLVSVQLYFGG